MLSCINNFMIIRVFSVNTFVFDYFGLGNIPFNLLDGYFDKFVQCNAGIG